MEELETQGVPEAERRLPYPTPLSLLPAEAAAVEVAEQMVAPEKETETVVSTAVRLVALDLLV